MEHHPDTSAAAARRRQFVIVAAGVMWLALFGFLAGHGRIWFGADAAR